MAEQAKEQGERFTVDGKEVSQVRYSVKLDKDSFLPKTESADIRLFKGRKEIAAFEGLTREELTKIVGPYNLASIENGVGANKRGQAKDEAGRVQAFGGKLEKDNLTPETVTAAGLEAKQTKSSEADTAQDPAQQVAQEQAGQRQAPVEQAIAAPLDEQEKAQHIEAGAQVEDADVSEVNSIEPDIEQEKVVQTMDDEVKRNLARMWLKRNQPSIDAAAEQSAQQEELNAGGGNEIDDDDVFADRNAKTVYRPVPKEIEDTYLRVGNKFHYASKPDLQAFEDKGNKLETKSNSERVAADLVKIAHARGWGDIKVKGSEEFRRQVWLEASIQGIGVKGYKPTEADRALLEKRQRETPANAIERDGTTQQRPTPSKAAEKAATAPQQATAATPAPAAQVEHEKAKEADSEKAAKAALLAGVLLEHGKAKFNFDKDEKDSYFVKYRDDAGEEKIVWGVDLARAMKESKAEIGQRIELENKGRQPVTVNAPVRDEEGKVVGFEKKETHRNAWEVKADALRNQDPKEAVKEHPELVNAYAIIKAAELVAKEKFKTAEDQQRFVAMTKETLAKHIEQNKAVPAVSIKETVQSKEQKREVEQELER